MNNNNNNIRKADILAYLTEQKDIIFNSIYNHSYIEYINLEIDMIRFKHNGIKNDAANELLINQIQGIFNLIKQYKILTKTIELIQKEF